MKKILIIAVLSVLSVPNYLFGRNTNLIEFQEITEEIFNAIKNNDLDLFKSYFVTSEELKLSINAPEINSEQKRQFKLALEKLNRINIDAFISYNFEKLRENLGFEWSNATYYFTMKELSRNYLDIGSSLLIYYTVNGVKRKIDRIEVINVQVPTNGNYRSKLVICDF